MMRMLVIAALAAGLLHAVPAQADLAAAATQAIAGAWKLDARSRPGDATGQLEYRADGSWELALYADHACTVPQIHAWGTWEVVDQRLVTHVVQSEDTNDRLRPGLTLIDDIVRVNDHELVLRFHGKLEYRARGRGCPADAPRRTVIRR
ncbi:MAG TPA: hypothetical protein VGN52_17750 [Burkholderiales bacterium]